MPGGVMSKQVRVRIDGEDLERLQSLAERLGLSMNELALVAIRAMLSSRFAQVPVIDRIALPGQSLTPLQEVGENVRVMGRVVEDARKVALQQEKVAAAYERAVEVSEHDWSEAETWVETEPWDPEAKADGVEQPDVPKSKRHLHKYTKKTGDAPSDKGQRYGVFMCECGETTIKPIRS